MPLRNDLLNPIPGAKPAGENLYYAPVYDKIKEARRQDDDLDKGQWVKEQKVADWPLTIKLISETLATKSKDLQLVVWLAEAMLRKEGITGFKEVLDLAKGMLEQFWDGLWPEEEDGDLEMRARPLNWLGDKYMVLPVKQLPLTKSRYNAIQYKESRAIGDEKSANTPDKKKAREAEIKAGKIPLEVFDKDFDETPKKFYIDLEAAFDSALESLESLGETCEAKFKSDGPSFSTLRTAMEEVRQTVHILLTKKKEKEPDGPTPEELAAKKAEEEAAAKKAAEEAAAKKAAEEAAAKAAQEAAAKKAAEEAAAKAAQEAAAKKAAEEAAAKAAQEAAAKTAAAPPPAPAAPAGPAAAAAAAPAPAPAPAPAAAAMTAEPANAKDAAARIQIVAQYLRKLDKASPAAYMMSAGFRWGEVRAKGELDPAMFTAPSGEVRQNLKKLAMENKWAELLEAAQAAVATEAGRAWLDGHRYIARACEKLGSSHSALRQAVISGVRALLHDYPEIPKMTLMDDLPTANAETMEWLHQQVVAPAPVKAELNGDAKLDVFDLAQQAVKKGKSQEGIEMLMREMAQERSGRGRFQRKLQLAQICVTTGHQAIAFPILQELAGEIQRRNLEEWEAADMVALSLALLYKCMAQDAPPEEKQKLYSWICRLDPLQAMTVAK